MMVEQLCYHDCRMGCCHDSEPGAELKTWSWVPGQQSVDAGSSEQRTLLSAQTQLPSELFLVCWRSGASMPSLRVLQDGHGVVGKDVGRDLHDENTEAIGYRAPCCCYYTQLQQRLNRGDIVLMFMNQVLIEQ
ncbi:hypothetical protein EYF80_007662 [Liparis tanakae]|uniref:Uncharacterized protein n=1 Tax=Liparis tanakae TaxID=230148 RepID=A0A4Z2IVV2_9TELE|nr:hypothetical protein EYF80_007662 [Liparis tanakae]